MSGGYNQEPGASFPSAGKWVKHVATAYRAPMGGFTLPGAPNLTAFALLQRAALQEAIRRGREKAQQQSAWTGMAPPFGLNRQYASIIEGRIKWWREASAKVAAQEAAGLSAPTRHAAGLHMEPNWAQIQRDLSGLAGAMAVALYGALDDHIGRLALDMIAGWPVDTGLSRALLQAQIGPGTGGHGELMRASVVAGAGYSGYIKEGGFRVVRESYTTKKGEQKTRTKHVYGEGSRLPAWKVRYLVKKADGSWRFDVDAYDAAAASGRDVMGYRDPDRKPAKGKPYYDLMLKPAPAAVAATGTAAVEAVAAAAKE